MLLVLQIRCWELRSFQIEMADDLFTLVEKNREHLQSG